MPKIDTLKKISYFKIYAQDMFNILVFLLNFLIIYECRKRNICNKKEIKRRKL